MAESLKKSFGLIKVDIHFNFLLTYSLPPQEFEYFSWGFNIVKKTPENRQVYTTKSMWNFRLQIKLWQVKSLNQSMVLWNCTCHYHLKYCNFERCCGNEFRYILKHMYSITAFQPFSRLWFSRLVKFMLFSVSITSQITPFSRECFLRHYGGQLKTAVEQEAGEKIDWKR